MKVTAFCDASYDRKTRSGGVGVYFQNTDDDDASISMPLNDLLDNNHGELFGICVVMTSMIKNIASDVLLGTHLTVYIDSDHAFDLVNGNRRVKEGRDAEATTLERVLSMMDAFRGVDLVCLKSHRGFSPLGMANEHCDRLAKKAMRGLRDGKLTAISVSDFFAAASQ